MKVQLVSSEEELRSVGSILLQLRPQYNLDSLISQVKIQQKAGYHLAYVSAEGQILSVAGFTVGERLAWRKYLYVDDLVSNEANRSAGAGLFLVQWLKEYGKEIGCEQLHLDSGVQNFLAHKFYLRENFKIASHHFSITEL